MAIATHNFYRLLAQAPGNQRIERKKEINCSLMVNSNQIDEILGSHGHEYENYHLLGYEAL
jgi:hypothetical protein